MFSSLKKTAFVATLGLGLATSGAASAASITFDLTSLPSVSSGPITVISGGETLTIEAVAIGAAPTRVSTNATGVGAGNNSGGTSRVDVGETLTFTFSSSVRRLLSAVFERGVGQDDASISDGDGNELIAGGIDRVLVTDPQFIPVSRGVNGNVFVFSVDAAVSGASGVRVSSITVSTIPLPAGGLLLVAGLGGLALARRRRKAA